MDRNKYDFELVSTAETILDECEEYSDLDISSDQFESDVIEEIDITADFHQWTTFYAYYLEVLQYSHNGPVGWSEHVEDGEDNHLEVIHQMALSAFRADLYEETMDQLRDRRSKLLTA